MNHFGSLRRAGLLYRIFIQRTRLKFYLRLFGYFFHKCLLRQMIPMTAMMALTYKCQCRCVHCAVDKTSVDPADELSTQELKACMDGLCQLGILKIGFTGGEPLLRHDICELVAHASRKGLSVSIDTNGMLLTSDMVLNLKRSGICNVNVSVDHLDARSHDSLRKQKGCFDKAVAGIQECVRQKIPCVISTYVTRWGRAKIKLNGIIALARRMQVTGVRVLFPIYSGKLSGRRRHLLSRDDKEDFFRTVANPDFVYSESPLFDFVTQRVECSAKRKLSVYITPDGAVKPCYASSRVFGNVRHANIRQILHDNLYFDARNVLSLKCEALHQDS